MTERKTRERNAMRSYEEKRSYLESYRDAGNELERLMEELIRWRALATRITPSCSKLPKQCKKTDHVQTAAGHIMALQTTLAEQVIRYTAARLDIQRAIDTVSSERLKLLLCYRYVDNLTMEQVAAKMNYSTMQIHRLLERALGEVRVDVNE